MINEILSRIAHHTADSDSQICQAWLSIVIHGQQMCSIDYSECVTWVSGMTKAISLYIVVCVQ
jgi:hypothetical protein